MSITNNVAEIVHGAATLWLAPSGESIPADSTAFGADWGGNWSKLGLTQEGVNLGLSQETTDINVQEALLPVGRFVSGGDVFVETVLSQMDGAVLQYAMGGGGTKTDTAAGAGTYGKTEFVYGGKDALTEYILGVEGKHTESDGTERPVRFFLWKCTLNLNGELEFEKARENGTGIPIRAQAQEDLSQTQGQRWFKYQEITADPTS